MDCQIGSWAKWLNAAGWAGLSRAARLSAPEWARLSRKGRAGEWMNKMNNRWLCFCVVTSCVALCYGDILQQEKSFWQA
jgi:hypothetical protein